MFSSDEQKYDVHATVFKAQRTFSNLLNVQRQPYSRY